jgi:hypothetical protein
MKLCSESSSSTLTLVPAMNSYGRASVVAVCEAIQVLPCLPSISRMDRRLRACKCFRRASLGWRRSSVPIASRSTLLTPGPLRRGACWMFDSLPPPCPSRARSPWRVGPPGRGICLPAEEVSPGLVRLRPRSTYQLKPRLVLWSGGAFFLSTLVWSPAPSFAIRFLTRPENGTFSE